MEHCSTTTSNGSRTQWLAGIVLEIGREGGIEGGKER